MDPPEHWNERLATGQWCIEEADKRVTGERTRAEMRDDGTVVIRKRYSFIKLKPPEEIFGR